MLENYPLPDYLQSYAARNKQRPPTWTFPNIPDTAEGISFKRLHFDNRKDLLTTFEQDKNEWVDDRFKDAEQLHEYVAHLMIIGPYSIKRGGCDWLIYQEQVCVGILHAFNFSKENFAYHHRRCFIGYAFSEQVRGTGLSTRVVKHFIQFLFQHFDLLFINATVNSKNVRSCRFLEKLGFEQMVFDEEDFPLNGTHFFELFRSEEAKRIVEADEE